MSNRLASPGTQQRVVHLHATSTFDGAGAPQDASLRTHLRTQHGKDGRRLSRFSLLALAAALPLRDALLATPGARTGIWLGAPFSSPEKFDAMLKVVTGERTAMPFDFIGNIHNAACFHVAQALDADGPSVFLAVGHDESSFAQPLLSALLDVQAGVVDKALVGWCVEQDPRRQDEDGCCWWLLSADATGAFARIDLVRPGAEEGDTPSESQPVYRDGLHRSGEAADPQLSGRSPAAQTLASGAETSTDACIPNPFLRARQHLQGLQARGHIDMPAPLGTWLRILGLPCA